MSNTKVIKTKSELIDHIKQSFTERFIVVMPHHVMLGPLSFTFDTDENLSSIQTGNGMIVAARLVQEDDDLPNYFKSYDRQGNFTGSITFTELPE